ncbi:unnamed protein product [Penicillium bialowiezense]
MPATFFNLPGEIRNEIYKYLLVRPVPIDPYEAAEYSLGPQILATNSTAYNEAIHLLYSANSFDLTRYKSDQWDHPLVPGFLNSIGTRNASLLQNLQINFPEMKIKVTVTEDGAVEYEDVALEPASLENIQLIQTYLSRSRMRARGSRSGGWRTATSMAMGSLERVVVEIHEGEECTDDLDFIDDAYYLEDAVALEYGRVQMHRLGWVLKEPVEALGERLRFTDVDDSDEEDLEYSEGGDELESESELAELLKEAEEMKGKKEEVSGETELDISRLTI